MSRQPKGAAGPHLCVLGDLTFDYYLELELEPWADEKATALSSLRMVGGTGANAAVAAARLGSAVALFAPVGDDPVGEWLRAQVAASGVDVSGVHTVHGHSTQATVLRDAHRRRIIVDRGVIDNPAPIDHTALKDADLVYATGSPAIVRALVDADLASTLVLGLEGWMAPVLGGSVLNASLAVTNSAGWSAFARELSGKVLTVATHGADGSTIHHLDGHSEHIPAYGAEVVDSTGAGDAFAGALCHYVALGVQLRDASHLAAAAAALSTRRPGAQAGLPTDAEVQDLITRGPSRQGDELHAG